MPEIDSTTLPDVIAPTKRTPAPVHLHWRYIGLVAAGGAVGTAARYLLTETIPAWHAVPLATLGINVAGALALGVLVEALARRGRDQGIRRTLRLLVGTGFLGGFTSYSAFSMDTVLLVAGGSLWPAVAYAVATVVLGATAAGVGIVAAAHQHRRRHPEAYPERIRTDAR